MLSVSRPRKVVVGIAGGVAAYKACHVVRAFKELGDDVRVVPTANALKFIGTATLEALSGNPVTASVYDCVDEVQHVNVGKQADLIVIAPATADLLARMAAGRADDLLTATLLVATCPVVVAPAMHTEMWLHPATQENVRTLRHRGIKVLDPAHGRLTGVDTGPGRLPDPQQIVDLALAVYEGADLPRDLENRKVVISAGGTQERIDPVRCITNSSSGRQGFAFAEIAAQRGADVVVVAGCTDELPVPLGSRVLRVSSARDMHAACMAESVDADIVVMAAAVADYRPVSTAPLKLKKGSADTELSHIALVENPDILRSLVEARQEKQINESTVIVGFAAETGDSSHSALDFAREKILRKGCDLLMCNEVGEGLVFGQARNRGFLLNPSGGYREIPDGSKLCVASTILDAAVKCLDQKRATG
ncbi:Coenzyme A biosynthesis bifunctional protein CoaBC [Corynebacterium pseudotuberculosis]|nr:phosphopantothenoylcysteine decarboxylase/phosphopantothenate--cysteine ligase [Corynebacterium pseudotuberculosis]VTQ74350.1 Coenzyme A biosynthesis bifunctional protein CoaBC [Corynebacterium pseudotuberculosis]